MMRLSATGSISHLPDGVDHIALARRLAPDIEAAAAEIEARRELPPTLVDTLVGAGCYRLLLPRSLTGAELDPASFAEFIEIIAGADASTAWCLAQCGGCAMAAGHLPPQGAHEIFAAPGAVVAWGSLATGSAVRVAGGYEVSGTFLFASGSRHAQFLGGHMPVVDGDGTRVRLPDGEPLLQTVVFPLDAARITDVWHVMGLRGTGSDNYAVERLFVPDRHSYLFNGAPDPSQPGTLYLFPITAVYAAGFAAVALGIARRMLDIFVASARDRVPRHATSAMRNNAVIQSEVGRAEAKLQASRLFLLHTLRDIRDAAATSGAVTVEQRMRIRLAASFASQQAKEVADVAYHAGGATAIFSSGKLERRFRDIHTVMQQIQARAAHFETVGQFLLGLPADLSVA
jgi:alkylation response protein AidB-like acyl-CoA dehydrogenase